MKIIINRIVFISTIICQRDENETLLFVFYIQIVFMSYVMYHVAPIINTREQFSTPQFPPE